jgi:hypothetical protein
MHGDAVGDAVGVDGAVGGDVSGDGGDVGIAFALPVLEGVASRWRW